MSIKVPKGMVRYYTTKGGERDPQEVLSKMTADINNVLADGKYVLKDIIEFNIFGGGFMVHFEEYDENRVPKAKPAMPQFTKKPFNKDFVKKPFNKEFKK